MTEAQKELVAPYADCVREYRTMAGRMLFQRNFHPGAKMMLVDMSQWHGCHNVYSKYQKKPEAVIHLPLAH